MPKIRTSLSPNRVNRLPVKRNKQGEAEIVKHRPQESASCVFAFGGTVRERGGRTATLPMKKSEVYQQTADKAIKEHVQVSEYAREYDNPDYPDTRFDENGKLQWTNESFTNLWQAMRYTAIANNPKNRERFAIGLALKAYRLSLRDAGICFQCKCPIKTKTAKVRFAESGEYTRDVIYANVKSHFRVYSRDDGRLEFRYFDGTGRKIYVRKGKFGDEFYCNDERVYPLSEYRVENAKCDCKLGS